MRCVNRSDKLIKPFELLRTGVALEEQIKTRDVGGQKHSVESWNFEHHDLVVLFVLSGKGQIIGRRINRVNFEISEIGKWQKQKHETWNVWDLMIKLNFSELKFLELDQCNISSVQDRLSNCSKIWVQRKSFSFGGFSSHPRKHLLLISSIPVWAIGLFSWLQRHFTKDVVYASYTSYESPSFKNIATPVNLMGSTAV